MEEAAATRTAIARLADTRAECNEQHKVMAAELEAMQNSVKSSLRAACQQNTVQSGKLDAMGYRLEEMKDLLLELVLQLKMQMAELNNHMRTLSTATRTTQGSEQAKANEPIATSSKTVPMRIPIPPITLKTSPKTEPKALKPPPASKKTTKVHVCASNSLSTVLLPPTVSLTQTQDQGIDPMTTTSSTIDLTDTKATAGSLASSAGDDTYVTAKTKTTGTSSMFLTASEGLLAGNPCASTTRKKENLNGDLSMQATRDSRETLQPLVRKGR